MAHASLSPQCRHAPPTSSARAGDTRSLRALLKSGAADAAADFVDVTVRTRISSRGWALGTREGCLHMALRACARQLPESFGFGLFILSSSKITQV